MVTRFRSWWQQIKQHRVAIEVVGIVLVVVITLIIAGYLFDWTGFNGYNKVTIAHIISGTNAGTVTRTEEYQPGKALWDWLQLLIIPAVLAVGGYLFNYTTTRVEQRNTQLRDQTEQAIASDNQREAALQAYIDSMSELLLHEKLRESAEDDEVRKIARVRTLTVLPRLDPLRKKSVLQFLHESGLIEKDKRIIDLYGADLREARLKESDLSRTMLAGADLRGANLIYTDLSGANLSNADMVEAYLLRANLTRANLNEASLGRADLSEANLSGANLKDAIGITVEELEKKVQILQGATMPDGSKHP